MKSLKALSAFAFIAISCIFPQVYAAPSFQDDPCKTYYDSARIKLKEVFECKTKYMVVSNPNTGKSEVQMAPTGIRHGLYIMYDTQGNQVITGYYADDVRTGIWKYYDSKGNVLRTEKYENGLRVN